MTPGGTAAAHARRLKAGYFDKLFVGQGLDIGAGKDPVTSTCDIWDYDHGDGDAQRMEGVPNESYDWVYSSHCLEHLFNPATALRRWWELVRPGGKLIVVVPDEDLYEQGVWPSIFNVDHKWTFRLEGEMSWSPVSLRFDRLIEALPDATVCWITRFDTDYDYSEGVWDRTLLGQEAHIEAVVLKGVGETNGYSI